MASAYAALRSLKHTLETINNLTRFSISIDKKQIESLLEQVGFLIDFLEKFSHRGNEKAQDLENRMADVAYNAEDAIESHVADEITGQTANSFDLGCFIEDLHLMISDTVEIKTMSAVENWQSNSSVSIDLSSSTPVGKSSMVGFDNELLSIKDTLTVGESNRIVIAIVGMGGIGKTTLAKSVCEDKLIVQYFDICVWVTISQEYVMKRLFAEVLSCIQKYQTGGQISEDEFGQISEDEFGQIIHKCLFNRRYLVVMDDMWEKDPWDRLQTFFPDNGKGSRIIVTTRNSDLATHFCSGIHRLKFLDETNSWNLLCKVVFGEKGCHVEELEDVGKKIAKNCKGLPLSIVVIGGLLAKSAKTKEYWEYVANDLNSIVNIEDNERTMKILYLSYHNLPIHLKPCFLYMGVFPEDKQISFSEVIQLWVAEGFLKPGIDKDLEAVGEEYLKDLLSRNLLINYVIGWSRVKYFKIHDILRDLCLRECQSQKFLNVQCLDTLECSKSKRRISNHKNTPKDLHCAKDSTSCVRSLLCHGRTFLTIFPLGNPKLLRILDTDDKWTMCYVENIVSLINSRHIALRNSYYNKVNLPSSFNLLWNLQFLKIDGKECLAPLEIWKMTQLRHVEVETLLLPDPPTDMQDNFVLENLHTLLQVENFRCTKEVVKRIPNINNLNIFGEFKEDYFKNLGHLKNLESLYCRFNLPHIPSPTMFQAFPISLKKLSLDNIKFDWKDLTHIGSLCALEELKLMMIQKCTPVWEPIEGEFSLLKLLLIDSCDLVEWRADDTHFPRLEYLELHNLKKLEEIPLGIGDIPTLQSIMLENCSESSILSAKAILDYVEELGNVGLQVHVNRSKISQEFHSRIKRYFGSGSPAFIVTSATNDIVTSIMDIATGDNVASAITTIASATAVAINIATHPDIPDNTVKITATTDVSATAGINVATVAASIAAATATVADVDATAITAATLATDIIGDIAKFFFALQADKGCEK